jgi:small subunit ribosomal protein S6
LAVKLYEGMFVVDSAKGGTEFPATVRLVAGMLTRHGAEIERIEKWAERKFAYPIKQSKRGIYILVYFKAEGAAIAAIREDVNLSEEILRVLVLTPHAVVPATGEVYNAAGEMIEAVKAPVTESAFAGTSSSETAGRRTGPAGETAQESSEEEAGSSGEEEEQDE